MTNAFGIEHQPISKIEPVAFAAGYGYRQRKKQKKLEAQNQQLQSQLAQYQQPAQPTLFGKSAFGIEHGPISKDEPSAQAKFAARRGPRMAGMAFPSKGAKKQWVADRKMAARTVRSGPYSGQNRRTLGRWTAGGTGIGAGLGAGLGAIAGKGNPAMAGLGAATGALVGAEYGASVGTVPISRRASARAFDRGIARGNVQTKVPGQQISWRGYRKSDSA